jgi:hypothetical protein
VRGPEKAEGVHFSRAKRRIFRRAALPQGAPSHRGEGAVTRAREDAGDQTTQSGTQSSHQRTQKTAKRKKPSPPRADSETGTHKIKFSTSKDQWTLREIQMTLSHIHKTPEPLLKTLFKIKDNIWSLHAYQPSKK